MDDSALERHRIKKVLDRLKSFRGRHTELISIYVPDGYDINLVGQRVKEEYSTAQNIKSKTTRKNVLGALEKISQFLKLHKTTPENGLIIFCGNVADQEGVSDIQLFALNPPEPISISLYRCLQEFVVEPLEEILRDKEVFGLLVLDRREATLGVLNGKRIDRLKKMTSGVPGKFRAGGQSARRFERLREAAAVEFFNRIGESANLAFSQIEDMRGLLIGGPSPTKEEFIKGPFLSNELKDKVVGLYDITYTDEDGLREIVNAASESLSELRVMSEKKVVRRFLDEVGKEGLASYGIMEIMELLQMGAVETLLISEEMNKSIVTFHCQTCKERFEKIVDDPERYIEGLTGCPRCPNGSVTIDEVQDLDDRMIEMAGMSNSDVELISADTEEGKQLLMAFGGLGAILRYKP